jgi:DNA-binding transcriptional LysR family regulator
MSVFHRGVMDFAEQVSRRLKMSDLRMLLAVAQWGSMSKAAAHLNISQSAISKAIKNLEHAIKVPLFDRTPQGVAPTMYAQALLRSGVAAFDELRQGLKQIEFLADPSAGELRIGSTEPLVPGVLAAVLDRLSRQYPRITFYVTQADFETLVYRELQGRRVDLIVGRIHGSIADGSFDIETLFHDQLFVAAGTNSPWVRRRRLELADVIDEPWILPPHDSQIGSLVAEAFGASGLSLPRASVVCFSIQMHNAMLATGRYLSMLSGSMLRLSGSRLSIKALPISVPITRRPVGIITVRSRTISPVAQLFIRYAREVCRPLAARGA